MQKYMPLIARILMSILFLMAGFNKIMDFSGTQQYMAAYGMPLTALFLIATILVEIGGGLSILLGFYARWGALVLFLFLIPTTLIFHTKFSDQTQMIMFMKNLTMMGGLLFVYMYGSGPLSIEQSKK